MATLRSAGFDWDTGNWEKCQKHGVSIAEIEAVLRAIRKSRRHHDDQSRRSGLLRSDGHAEADLCSSLSRCAAEMGLALSGPSALVICMPRRSSDMKRRVPRLTTDEEAETFLETDLSDLDFSQFKSRRLRFDPRAKPGAVELEPSETYRLFEKR
jgi:hypothetical protein